jgi:protein O-mannosyl-transferase
MSKTDRLALAALLVAVACAFAPSLGYGFVYDDFPQIVDNATFGAPGLASRIFAENVWSFAPDVAEPRYYRPTFVAWLHGTWALVRLSSVGWHASTLLLHLMAVAALYVFVRRYSGSWLIALLGAGLFAIHPTRAESVAWIGGATDPLAALFGFGAMTLLLTARPDLSAEDAPPKRGAEAAAVALFALALMSKETALVFVCAPAGMSLFGRRSPTPWTTRAADALRTTAPWAAVALAYLVVRHGVIGALSPAYQELSAGDQLRTGVVLVGTYVEHLVLPGRLSLTTPLDVVTAWGSEPLLRALPGLILSAVLFVAAAMLGKRSRLLIWLGLGFLLPVLRVESLQPDMMFQDRYLYLPSACWLPALVWAMVRAQRASDLPPAAVASVVGLLTLFLVGVLQVNMAPWASNGELWERAVEVHPQSGRAWFNLGTERENSDDLAGAEAAYLRAATEEPERALFHFRLGYMYAERQALAEARTAFGRAAMLRPQDPMMLYEAGRIERFLGEPDEARRLLDAAGAAADAGAAVGGGITREDIRRERASLEND